MFASSNNPESFGEFRSRFDFQLLPSDDIYGSSSLRFISDEPDHNNEFTLQHCSETHSKAFLSEIILNQDANPTNSEIECLHECNTCKKTFSNLFSLKRHKRRVHLNKKPYSCIVCHRTFLQLSLLSRHSLLHLRTKPEEFICQICEKTFSKSVILQKHIFSIHACEGKPFCFGCFQFFPTKEELDDHMKDHLVSDAYDCDKCKKRYKCEMDLKKHRCIYNGPRPFICKLCGKRFNRLYHLQRHLDLHNKRKSSVGDADYDSDSLEKQNTSIDSTDSVAMTDLISSTKDDDESLIVNKKFECYICNKRWSSFRQYKEHFLSIHQDVTFNACHICSKQFAKSSKVKRHLLVHSKVKDFKCEICFNTFASPSAMNKHMKKHSSEERPSSPQCLKPPKNESLFQKNLKECEMSDKTSFMCPVCKIKFSEENILDEHILASHNSFKEFQCSVCQRRFKRYNHLKRHMSVHIGLKRFKCNSLFSTNSELEKHSLVHENKKAYQCYFCDKYFSKSCQRQKHLATCFREKKRFCLSVILKNDLFIIIKSASR